MIREKRHWTKAQIKFALALHNHYLFTMMLWKDDLTIPKNDKNLPEEWRGKQVISKEQRLMFCDKATKQEYCTARKTAKTINMESYYFQWPILNLSEGRRTEGMFYTPREAHRDQFLGRIKMKNARTPFLSMFEEQFSYGSNEFVFKTDFVWYNRIEGNPANAGVNMVGPRCRRMLGDEMAYGNDAAHDERLNTAMPDALTVQGGVPNGRRNTRFHQISENRIKGWSVHHTDFRANAIYHSEEAYRDLVREHGGINTQSFITQVLGQWGEATVASFPIIPQVSHPYYTHIELSGDRMPDNPLELLGYLHIKIPPGAEDFIIGGDLGTSPAPTILTLMYLSKGAWLEFATVEMLLGNQPRQADLIDLLAMRVLPKRPIRICLDAHGSGSGTLGNLHTLPGFDRDYYKQNAFDAGFAGSMPDPNIKSHRLCGQRVRIGGEGTWFCDHCKVIISDPESLKDAMIPTKQYLTNALKESMLNGQAYLDRLTAGIPQSAAVAV